MEYDQMDRQTPAVVARFFKHTEPDPVETKKQGRPIYKEIDVCEIRFPGDRNRVSVFPAHDISTFGVDEFGNSVPLTYAQRFKEQYHAFINDEAQEQAGTPLSELPFLTEAKRRELKALNVFTAEALAALDGPPLKALGMNGRELKNQATAYIEKAKGSADVTAMAAENAALKARIEEMMAERKEASEAAKSANTFTDWDDEDLKKFIAEKTGGRPRGVPNHDTLVRMATEAAEVAQKSEQAA